MYNKEDNSSNSKNDDSKKIYAVLVLIAILMISVTGGTYAYFALSATSNNVISGTAATANLELSVSQTYPTKTNTGVMVPQLESSLATAMGTTYGCVDSNTNIVCKVYTITVTNKSSAKAVVNGTITFSNSTALPNLKWRKATNATTLGTSTTVAANNSTVWDLSAGTACTVSTGSGCTDISLAPNNGTATIYIVVWINETGSAQNDNGTFTATIKFEGKNGKGVTSTVSG